MILQVSTDQIKEIISTNDATTTGVLIAITIAFGATIIYLFKQNQKVHSEFILNLKESNEVVTKLYLTNSENTQKFHDFAKDLIEVKNSVQNLKSK